MISELRERLDPKKVSTMAEVLEEHGTDRWNFSHLPEVVVFAECRDDVVEVMKFANERGVPVTTRGAGVGYVGGCVPVEGGGANEVSSGDRARRWRGGDPARSDFKRSARYSE